MRTLSKLSTILTALAAMASFGAEAAQNCPPVKVLAEVDMLADPNGAWVIPVTVVDRQKLFLVSTGALASQLGRALVNELSLPTGSADFDMFDIGGRRIQAVRVRPPLIQIGALRRDHLPFLVADGLAGDVAGFIGPDILREYGVEIDFAGRKFRLLDPDHCAGQGVTWPAAMVAALPMRIARVSGHATVDVTIDGVKFVATLSTANVDTSVNANLARRRLKFDPAAPDVEQAGELRSASGSSLPIYKRRFQSIGLGEITLTDPVLHIMPDLIVGKVSEAPTVGSLLDRGEEATRLPEVLLGSSVFNRLHVYISYRERKLYISPASAPSATNGNATSPAPQ